MITRAPHAFPSRPAGVPDFERAVFDRMIEEAALHFESRRPFLATRRMLAGTLTRIACAIAPQR